MTGAADTPKNGTPAPTADEAAPQNTRSSITGPGISGRTTSGAAYRGTEIAANEDREPPADPGFP